MRTRLALLATAFATSALIPFAMAQNTGNPGSSTNAPAASHAPATQPPGTTAAPGTTTGPAASPSRAGTNTQGAPMGSTAGTTTTRTDGQSAVRTENPGDAPATTTTPVAGANSFTEGQARSRIEAAGFTGVQDLRRDDAGVWRGRAMRGGQTADVGLDFRGNVVIGNAPASNASGSSASTSSSTATTPAPAR